mmetsp:Transcript_22454/g.45019  ORF Transcript_22454/g.45019 Transcript_22454/m.45019 type:complete len:92 (-) Transcript_22454:614-889(-)
MVKKEKKMTERKSNQFMQKTIYAKKNPAAHFSVGFLTSSFGAPFNNDDEIKNHEIPVQDPRLVPQLAACPACNPCTPRRPRLLWTWSYFEE